MSSVSDEEQPVAAAGVALRSRARLRIRYIRVQLGSESPISSDRSRKVATDAAFIRTPRSMSTSPARRISAANSLGVLRSRHRRARRRTCPRISDASAATAARASACSAVREAKRAAAGNRFRAVSLRTAATTDSIKESSARPLARIRSTAEHASVINSCVFPIGSRFGIRVSPFFRRTVGILLGVLRAKRLADSLARFLTIRISCQGRLQDLYAARNQNGGPVQLHPLVSGGPQRPARAAPEQDRRCPCKRRRNSRLKIRILPSHLQE